MSLILYLDTQDYINLFNEPDDGPYYRVLSDILAFRDHGDLIIGFSFATIMEFITKPNQENRLERGRRGQLIKDICGQNAFPYLTDLADGARFPNGGNWMTSENKKFVSARKFRREIHQKLIATIADQKGLNRNQRRILGRKSTVSQLIRESGATWGRTRSDYGDFPVSDEIIESRVLERFMKGQCSDQEFEQRLNGWLTDPAEFSRLAYDYKDMPNMIDTIFGTSVDSLVQAIGKVVSAVNTLTAHNEKTLETRRKLTDAGVHKRNAKKLTKQIKLPTINASPMVADLEALLGVGRAGHIGHYLEKTTKRGFHFKRSDIMDIMQMCYTYDCDLFRCDKAMAHMFNDYGPFKGKLVSHFNDLPERIQMLLDT